MTPIADSTISGWELPYSRMGIKVPCRTLTHLSDEGASATPNRQTGSQLKRSEGIGKILIQCLIAFGLLSDFRVGSVSFPAQRAQRLAWQSTREPS